MTQPKLDSLGSIAALFATATWGLVGIFIRWLPGWSPFFCYTVAAQKLPIVLTTAILLLEPMFAVLFASIALREIPSLWFGIGSILVFWGLLYIASSANRSSVRAE
jgi:EamA-like transporter family